MKNIIKKYGIYIIIGILLIISIVNRIPKETEIYNDCDATYHVLLTMKCYDETSISVHKFLPIVSLGGENDKNIPWGDCVPDKDGNYYYTSFSSLAFWVPYLFIKLFNLPINVYSLYIFNSLIYCITTLLIVYISNKLFSKYVNKNIVMLFTALIYMFQIEIMQSQGAIYWAHSIFQLMLAIQFILFMNFKNKKAKIGFYIMCLVMPYTECTGYISNVAFAIILFFKDIEEKKKITCDAIFKVVLIGVLTILSFWIYTFHFLQNIDFNTYLMLLQKRFMARNYTYSGVKQGDLFYGYFVSYSYSLIFILALLVASICKKKYRIELRKLVKEYKYELIFFVFIMLENVIMMQHAVQYTFDRMKLVYLLIILFWISSIAIYVNLKSERKIYISLIGVAIAIVVINNFVEYKDGIKEYRIENTYYKSNNIIAEYIKNNYSKEESVTCCNRQVRGYINLLFDRGMYEFQSLESALEILEENKKQYLIYIFQAEDGMEVQGIYIIDTNNNSIKFISENNDKLVIENRKI